MCVCLMFFSGTSREQEITQVVSDRIIKIEQYNISEKGEMIFCAPANLKSNVWKSIGFYKKEGNIDKSLAICKLCRTAIKSINKQINRHVVLN